MAHATTTIAADLAGVVARQERVVARRMTAALAGDVTGVHRARVASRRLREVLAVAAAAYPSGGEASRVRRAVRRLTRALGPIREIDVSVQELEQAAGRHAWPPDAVAAVRRRLERERERRHARLADRYDRSWLGGHARQLSAAITATPDATWWRALVRRAVQRAGEAGAAAAACGTLYVPERLHALRIATKKLRYALELLPSTPGFDTRRATARLKRAQDAFGHLHDVQVLLAAVQATNTSRRRTPAGRALGAMSEDLERDCRRIHAGVLRLVPDVAACAAEVRRELSLRRRGRLAMAKAAVGRTPAVEAASPAQRANPNQ